jgi:serine protease Do
MFPQPRLGVLVDSPSEAMTEQLGLESGKGVVVTDVLADSAAAKAGLKKNDVLVEFNGKPVPASRDGFAALVQEPKAKEPVDAVVIRKGKKETIKGITLPEATAPGRPGAAPFAPPRRGFRMGITAPRVRVCGC